MWWCSPSWCGSAPPLPTAAGGWTSASGWVAIAAPGSAVAGGTVPSVHLVALRQLAGTDQGPVSQGLGWAAGLASWRMRCCPQEQCPTHLAPSSMLDVGQLSCQQVCWILGTDQPLEQEFLLARPGTLWDRQRTVLQQNRPRTHVTDSSACAPNFALVGLLPKCSHHNINLSRNHCTTAITTNWHI